MANKKAKPTPEMLGSGAAYKAGKAIRGRGRNIDAAVDAMSSGKKPPAKKK